MSFLNLDSSNTLKDMLNEAQQHEEPRLPTRRYEPDAHDARPVQEPAHKPFPSLFSRLLHLRKEDRPHKSREWFKRLTIAVVLLVVLVVGAFVGVSSWLRHAMHQALPQIDGSIQAAGLHGSVTITRDAQGVPSIQAANLDDLLFAQGFTTAQDRLWQMDMLRRHAAGEIAEVLGSKLIEHDRMQRILQIRATAERALAALPADQQHQLQAYAKGVNAFIEQNADRLPVEFHLLHYKPAPWTPRDTMLVSLSMFQDLGTQFPVKMKRESLSAHLPAQLLADLYPIGSWRDRPPTQPPPDLTTPKPEIEEIPLDDTQVRLRKPTLASPQDVLRVSSQLQGDVCDDCRSGSNNWAVAGTRSVSGFPLLSNDMHLHLNAPDIWYEAGLHCPLADGNPEIDVAGFTLPGAPFVIVGRNAHVAWGVTNLAGDVQDVRIEHTRDSNGSTEYQKADGTWTAIGHAAETIHVRGGRDITLDVLVTTAKIGNNEILTPVISPLYLSEHRTLSLAWSAYDPANLAVPFFAVNTATTGAAVVSAFANFGGPSLNLVYADDAKHIGYHAIGRIPVRGPMERRARTITPITMGEPQQEPETEKVPETEEEESDKPAASLMRPRGNFFAMGRPMLLDAAYSPARRKAVPRREKERQAPPAPVKEEPLKPLPPAIDYTIGSPVSSIPVDALDLSQQWSGYIPYNELPYVIDPPNGIVATANSRITANDYPYFIANNWAAPFRTERITKLLTKRRALTPNDMLTIQNDVHNEFDLVLAQRLVYALDHASKAALSKNTKQLQQASDILRKWDGSVSADSSAAAIIAAFRKAMWPALLLPQIETHDHLKKGTAPKELAALYQWGGETVAFEALLQHTPRRWLPTGAGSWNDLLATTLAHALDEAHTPASLNKWHYGSESPAEIPHPVLSQSGIFRRLLGTSGGSGKHEAGGDPETVRAAGKNFGPSERFDADLADADATLGNITTGESGNPASPWYLDQFKPWLQGTSFTLPLHPFAAQHTLTLTP